MPLPQVFAYDTETGLCEDGMIRTVLLQYCPVDAGSIKEAQLIEGEDCIAEFFRRFEETELDMECHAYNLSYEISWLEKHLTENYQWTDERRNMPRSSFSVLEDPVACYQVRVCSAAGYVMTITDDMRRLGSLSMKEASENVRRSHPEWFPGMEKTKEDTELYNVWYLMPDGPERRSFIEYARLDVWSQAMIARWVRENGLNGSLTSAGAGLKMALGIRYSDSIEITCKKDQYYARLYFGEKYPPLPREMQDFAESRILAGYVWGKPGTHKGRFWHYDYSSSYPYEYRSGKLFIGKVWKILPTKENRETWNRIMRAPGYFRWFVCSFDFKIKENGIPMISGRECVTVDNRMIGHQNEKMREGHCTERLYTETYLIELMKNYDLEDLSIYECWFAKRCTGDFKGFIEYCYMQKSKPEYKGTMQRHIWKLFMNGGIHGKTITKTHRKRITYRDGTRQRESEINDPQFCFMIGFTAMMNARERLIRHCRQVKEAGYEIYMCDTDSMVTDCPPERMKEILGEDAFTHPDGGIENLGKFECEDFEGREEFDEFRCWGLKRYLELDHGRYRKSAFAGMHDELQRELLPTWKTDGTKYSWSQKGRHSSHFGKVIEEGIKTAGAESPWYDPTPSVPFHPDRSGYEKMCESIQRKYQRILETYGEEYLASMIRDMAVFDDEGGDIDDMIAYLKDTRDDEKDHTPITKKNAKKKFIKRKWEEERDKR